jgi:hypothetical protein
MIIWMILRQGLGNLLTALGDLRQRRRLRSQQAKIRKRIKRHFTQVGEAVHRNRGELDRDNTVPSLSQEIVQLENRLTEIDLEISQVGGDRRWGGSPRPTYVYDDSTQTASCPACAANFPQGSKFCPACGQTLS